MISLPEFSVKRPIFTFMVTLIVVVLGLFSVSRLKIDLLPDIELPTVSVRAYYPRANPEVVERLITEVLEEIIATVPGVEEISTTSVEGASIIRVTFGWGTDIDTAALDVQSKIEDEINELPDDVNRPTIRKFDVESLPVVLLGISSHLDPVEMTELVDNQIRYRFSRINGVAQVDIWGGYNREIRVELNYDRLNALGIPLATILSAIRDANLDLPTGSITRGKYDISLRAPAEFTGLNQIRDTVVASHDGTLVTLGQVATVVDTYSKRQRIVRVNGRQGLRVAIRKQADANTVEVAKNVLAEIDKTNAAFPQLNIVPVINQGNFIERSITNVANSVLYGAGFAVVILLLFLRNLKSTLVISLAIPISITATFALIFFGGFTLNLMTLGGLALGVGMMVDSSIVVLENIYRKKTENRENRWEAAVSGTSEVSQAIIASTITTLVIFLPMIFLRGVSGILFKEMAYVIIFSLVCALLVALSLVPMLASKLITSQGATQKQRPMALTRAAAAAESLFNKMEGQYQRFLAWVLDHRAATVGITAAVLAGALFLFPLIGKEFLPPSDEGEVRVSGEMETGTRLEVVDERTRIVEKIVFENVPEMVSSVTRSSASNSSGFEIRLSLTPSAQRRRSNTEIADDLRKRLANRIPGVIIRTRAPQGQFILERLLGGVETVTVDIRGYDLAVLNRLADLVSGAIADIPGITDIDTSQEKGMPQEEIIIDRHKIADLGLTVRDVADVLKTAVAGSEAGEYRVEGNSHRIFVKLEDAENRSMDEILDLTLNTAVGTQVALTKHRVHPDGNRPGHDQPERPAAHRGGPCQCLRPGYGVCGSGYRGPPGHHSPPGGV